PGAPFVEDIVGRAFQMSPFVGVLALCSFVPACLGAYGLGRAAPSDSSATVAARGALTVYFVAAALVPLVGEFPVPLLGFGASSIVGAFLGLATFEWTRGAHVRNWSEDRREKESGEEGRGAAFSPLDDRAAPA